MLSLQYTGGHRPSFLFSQKYFMLNSADSQHFRDLGELISFQYWQRSRKLGLSQ